MSQVLSHLGSGAEIALAGYVAALAGDEPPRAGLQPDGLGPVERARPAGAGGRVPGAQRGPGGLARGPVTRRPREPPDQAGLPARAAPDRLGGRDEAARGPPSTLGRPRGVDPAARDRRRPGPAALRAPRRRPGLPAPLHRQGRPARRAGADRIEAPTSTILVEDHVSVSTSATDPTATFHGTPEAALRLLAGRLKAPYIPAGVDVTGNVNLDDLVRVFPGY